MEQNQNSSLFGLNIDPGAKAHLSETARWAKFLAIVGFILCGLVILIGIFFGSIFGSLGRLSGNDFGGMPVNTSGFGAIVGVIYALAALLYFFPCLFLYRFATHMKTALANNEQETLNSSFQNLKKMFRFVGILTIIALAFYTIVILLTIVIGSTARF